MNKQEIITAIDKAIETANQIQKILDELSKEIEKNQ